MSALNAASERAGRQVAEGGELVTSRDPSHLAAFSSALSTRLG
ncbi:MAG: hypothetical protein ABW252_18060 [Polyangiales bacterium]